MVIAACVDLVELVQVYIDNVTLSVLLIGLLLLLEANIDLWLALLFYVAIVHLAELLAKLFLGKLCGLGLSVGGIL